MAIPRFLNPKKSFRIEILYYILFCSLLPALIILMIFSRHLTSNLHEELVSHVERMEKVAVADVDHMITRFKSNIAEQSKANFVAELLGADEDVEENLHRLVTHLKQAAGVKTAYLYNTKGLMIASTQRDKVRNQIKLDFLDRIEAKKEGEIPVLLQINVDPGVGFRVSAYAPVTEPFYKYLIGVLQEHIYIDREFITRVKNKTGLEVALFYQEESFIHTSSVMPVLDTSTYRTLTETKTVTTQNTLILDGDVYHAVLIPLESEGGIIVGAIGLLGSEAVIEQSKIFIQKISLIALLSISFLSFVMSQASTRRVIKPILDVVASLRRTAKGDLSQRIVVRAENEIGELAQSFNKMTEDLQHSREELITIKDYTDNIVKSMVDTLIVVDPGGVIMTVNKATLDLLGYTENEIKGKSLSVVIAYENNVDSARFQETLKANAIRNFELMYKTRTGNLISMLFSGSAMRNQDGEIEGIVCIARDITALKKTEEQLRKLSRTVEQSPSLVMITDTTGAIEYVNPKFIQTTGYALEEIEGKTSRFLKSDKTPQSQYQLLWKTILSGQEWRGEFQNKKKSGELYWVSTSISPIRNQEGVITHFLSVGEDMTMRKQAEEALRESEERFRQFFEQNEDAIMLFKAGDSRILNINPAAVALYGYTLHELIDQGPSLFVKDVDYQNFIDRLDNIDTANAFFIAQQTHMRKDGTHLMVEIRGMLIRLQQSHVSYCTFHDITEKIRMEEEAMRIQGRLIHTNKMTSLGTMVSGVAHEINNPNNVMMFNAPLIADAWKDAVPILTEYYKEHGAFSMGGLPFPEMCELLPKLTSAILDSSHRIKNIVDSLKDFARQNQRGVDNAININSVIRAATDLIRNQIEKSTQHFHLDYEENLPSIKGNAQQLEQVMINLIINALQSLRDNKGGIWVSTSMNRKKNAIIMKVRDEGCGMSEEVIERIMEPFYTTRINSGGTGLGLSISYSIIKEHGGSLEYRSEIDKGTTALVTLPV